MNDLPQPSSPPPDAPPATSENSWALLIHLSAFLHLLAGTFPIANVIGPLVLWLIKRGESPYLDGVGKRVLNFQISWAIYFALIWTSTLALIGWVLLPFAAIAWVIFTIIGAIRESNRQPYHFPLAIQFLK
jgi:uncharacterized Tic20 family protein